MHFPGLPSTLCLAYTHSGPNGSGKSTLMNILTDNLDSDEGNITFAENDGEPRDVRKMGVEFREKLGFMPQYPGLYPNFTVERFLYYMATLKGMNRDDAKRQITLLPYALVYMGILVLRYVDFTAILAGGKLLTRSAEFGVFNGTYTFAIILTCCYIILNSATIMFVRYEIGK